MSGMLTRLHQTFDDPLFVRGQRGIVPTQRALDLSMPLKQVIAEIDVLLQPPVFDPANARLTFTLAATDYALRAVVQPFLAALKVQASYVQVALVPVDDRQVQAQLERGDLDVALVTREGTAPDLHARNLFAERYVCVLREGHPAIQAHASLTLKRLCELDHALVSYHGSGFRGVTDETLERLGRTRRVSLSVKSCLILPEILRTSDMVAILPSRLVAGIPGQQVFDPPLDIAGLTKVACWHERTHRDPGQRWLRALLFQTCSDQHG